MTIDIRKEMTLALNAFQSGNIDVAESKLNAVLAINPRSADVLHLLGVIKGLQNNHSGAEQFLIKAAGIEKKNRFIFFNLAKALSEQGKHAESIQWHKKGIALDPKDAMAWLNYGKSLYDLEDLNNAINAFDQAIAINNNLAEAYTNKAICLRKKRDLEEALDLLNHAIALNPNLALAWNNRGSALNDLKRHEEALASYQRCIELQPNYAEAWSNRGLVLNQLKRHQEALASYDRCIELEPDYAEAWSNRGVALNDLTRHQDALASYDRCIELKPDYAEAWSNRGISLNDLKCHTEALTNYERSIELKPGYAEAWSNRGIALNDLKRHEEALASYERCIALKPDHAEAWSNRGSALNDLKRYEEALASFERCIELKPGYAEAIYNKGLLQLSQRNFLTGFESYLYRWQTKKRSSEFLQTCLPLCTPESFNGHVLLWAEQGLGDEIFYASMLSQANSLCSKITLSADKRLHSIFKRSMPEIDLIDSKLLNSQPILYEGAHAQAPIGDLGYLLRLNSETIAKSRKPFLLSDKVKTLQAKNSLPFSSDKLVCGLSWKSINKDHGDAKSLNLPTLEPLLNNKKLSFVNLQYGEVSADIKQITNASHCDFYNAESLDLFNDIDDLLSLIDSCDVVITTSNVTAHLAGSIGKKGCVLVPFAKGKIWYWHLNDAYSFWYPSLKVFYQENPNDWSNTVDQMIDWLEEECL